jgi:hypothetical protein
VKTFVEQLRIEVIDRAYAAILAAKTPAERAAITADCNRDVILGKLWYHSEGGGDRHLRDIAGILGVTGNGVDRAEVESWATKLGYLETWWQIVAKVDAPDAPPGPGNP